MKKVVCAFERCAYVRFDPRVYLENRIGLFAMPENILKHFIAFHVQAVV